MSHASGLRAAGLGTFPCDAQKRPAVPKGTDWHDAANWPVGSQAWATGLVGVPVPAGVVIVDLDTYKGVTREAVEQHTGPLPWDAALIQTTARGGQHYAFKAPAWPVRQGSDIGGVQGLDTRTGGKGYIATGTGYTPAGAGLYRLASPDSLPELPDSARQVLEHVKAAPPPPGSSTATGDEPDEETVRDALRHIDPGGSRTEWVRVGMALRAGFAHDEAAGYGLFEEWSAGELWPDGCPDNYQPDGPGAAQHQFASFKAEGDTQLGTLFYDAIASGWKPPRGAAVDTSAAFGPGAAAPDAWRDLLDRIQSVGGLADHTQELADAIQALPCTPLQRAALSALLQRELKESGLLTPEVRKATTAATPGPVHGRYDKNHSENAALFLQQHYPDGTLIQSEQVWYAYTGKCWEALDDDAIGHKLTAAMLHTSPADGVITGTLRILRRMVYSAHARISDRPDGLVLFQNGVLRLADGMLLPHSPEIFTTNILPYDYRPGAACPRWEAFLMQAFSGDRERLYLLQEWFGYLLTSSYAHHKIMMLIGPSRSGKGTIGRMLEQVIGETNYTGGSLHNFASDSLVCSWRHKPAMFIGDAEQRVAPGKVDIVIERIKQISGNDSVAFDRKYASALSETLPTRITIATNSIPRLFDDSGALAARMMPLPLDVSHLGREDITLFDRLQAEVEGVGQWALEGLRRLLENGRFTVPAASAAEAQFMAENYSPMTQFISECCRFGPGLRCPATDLYDSYRAWATANSEDRILSRRVFVGAIKDSVSGRARYGVHRFDGESARGFEGVGLAGTAPGLADVFKPAVVAGTDHKPPE